MDILHAIHHRRTHKTFASGTVSDELLRELLEAAICAPNHGLTEPWRFSVVRKGRLGALTEVVHAALEAKRKPDAGSDLKLATKQDKIRRRLAGAAAVVAVCQVISPTDEVRDREDYAATACAVQNLMLAATGRALVCLWSTSRMITGAAVREFLQIPPTERIVGVVFLGHPTGALPRRRRLSIDDVTRWL